MAMDKVGVHYLKLNILRWQRCDRCQVKRSRRPRAGRKLPIHGLPYTGGKLSTRDVNMLTGTLNTTAYAWIVSHGNAVVFQADLGP